MLANLNSALARPGHNLTVTASSFRVSFSTATDCTYEGICGFKPPHTYAQMGWDLLIAAQGRARTSKIESQGAGCANFSIPSRALAELRRAPGDVWFRDRLPAKIGGLFSHSIGSHRARTPGQDRCRSPSPT